MKTRKFRPWVEYTLTIIAMFMFMFLASIDDFEIQLMSYIILGWIIFAAIALLLNKYGKRRIFENAKRD